MPDPIDGPPAGAASGAVHAERFAPLSPERSARFQFFNSGANPYFPGYVGLKLEEVRVDYARFRLPWRDVLLQPAGVLHGGAIATLIDTAVVPAIASAFDGPRVLLTIDMHVQFLAAIRAEDAIAEAWVERRGRSIVFCRVEVRSAAGELAATGAVVYKVGPPR
jgi:uncharacterized protein (TIGR00369 family)